jgi:hypothetical protein
MQESGLLTKTKRSYVRWRIWDTMPRQVWVRGGGGDQRISQQDRVVMKTLIRNQSELRKAARWDIDFHLPAEGIKKFPSNLLCRVDQVANTGKDKRDPTKTPEVVFQYIDISSVDVSVGEITNPQETEGLEAPSRARKVVQAFDLIISTCRPTRGAIAVVPPSLHNQIASTGFSIIRPHDNVNPFYLHYALRLPSTLEQFRKWSTGSSYPAILDDDVAKTLIPVPDAIEQDRIAGLLMRAFDERARAIQKIDGAWRSTLNDIFCSLSGQKVAPDPVEYAQSEILHTIEAVRLVAGALPPLLVDNGAQAKTEELELLL